MLDFYVIVAGMGRCGTTLIYSSLAEVMSAEGFCKILKKGVFENGKVYKTHDLPPKRLEGNAKVIFMFGNPMNITVSAERIDKEEREKGNKSWYYAHYKHLKRDVSKKDLFHREDTFGLSNQFDLWYAPQTFPLLTVRYETMHENIGAIRKFIGIENLSLSEKQNRKSDYSTHPHKEDLEKTYASLNQKVMQAEDIKIWQPRI